MGEKTENKKLFSDLQLGFEELHRSKHFLFQMLSDKARVRVFFRRSAKDGESGYWLMSEMEYKTWRHLLSALVNLKVVNRDIVRGRVELRLPPITHALIWVDGRQMRFQNNFPEFKFACIRADQKILRMQGK
jgi:hypothetical protein